VKGTEKAHREIRLVAGPVEDGLKNLVSMSRRDGEIREKILADISFAEVQKIDRFTEIERGTNQI